MNYQIGDIVTIPSLPDVGPWVVVRADDPAKIVVRELSADVRKGSPVAVGIKAVRLLARPVPVGADAE